MGHDIRSEIERTAEIRGREGVVHDQRNAVFMCDFCKLFDIENDQSGIREHFREDRLCSGADRRLKFRFGDIRRDECEIDPHLLHGVGEQGDRSAVEAGDCNDMVAASCDVQESEHIRVLTG